MEIKTKLENRFSTLDKLFKDYIESGKYPCIVAGVYHKENLVFSQKYGFASVERKIDISFESIFRIASLSKAITCVGALLLIDKGLLNLNDKLSKFFPKASNLKVFINEDQGQLVVEDLKKEITILDLFTHTSGFIYPEDLDHPIDKLYDKFFGPFYINIMQMTNEEIMDKLLDIPLKVQPGTKYNYSFSTDVLGFVIEKISGKNLEEYLHNELFIKLHMPDTYFNLPETKRGRLVTQYHINDKGMLVPLDQRYQVIGNMPVKFLSGGGGLLSTFSDYLNFSLFLLNKGLVREDQLISEPLLELMATDQMTPRNLSSFSEIAIRKSNFSENYKKSLIAYRKGTNYGIGVQVKIMAEGKIPKGVFGWVGVTTTNFFVDRENEIIGIFLSQYDGLFDYPIFAEFIKTAYNCFEN